MKAPQGATTSAKRPYHRGNVADDLIAAAERLLKTERYEDISVRRLAREIGVTPANFYNHFDSLDTLFRKIATKGHVSRAARVRKISETSADRIEAAKATALHFVETAVSNPELFRLMFNLPSRITDPEFVRAADQSFGAIVRLVYGEDLFDPTNLKESRKRCQTAYGYFALVYGLTRVVSELNFPMKTKAERKSFVESIVQGFIDGTASADFKRKRPAAK